MGSLAPPVSRAFVGTTHLTFLPSPPLPRVVYPTPMERRAGGSSVPVFVDPVQGRGASASTLSAGTGFDGMDFTECSCTPPDVQVGASPRQVVELVNSAIEVWSTAGSSLSAEYLYTLFNISSSDFVSDPKVIYDADSGRWLVSAFACTVVMNACSVYFVPFAISKSSDAMGSWWVYTSITPSPSGLPDQPILGVSHDLVSLSANVFSGGGYAGAEFWLINKSAAVNGSVPAYARYGPYPFDGSIHPVRTVQAKSGLFLVESLPGSPGNLELFNASHVPPALTSVSTFNFSLGKLSVPPAVRQPGTTDTLDGGSGLTVRVSDALWAKGRLWATFSDTCLVAGSNNSCIRLVEVNTTSTPTIYQDFDVGVKSADVFYGAISLDPSGNLVVNFGIGSSTLYPSTLATYQAPTDPLGTVRPAIPLHNGSASISCGSNPCPARYGDYFGSSGQPGSSWIWTGGEYVTSTTIWQTWIQAVRAVGPMTAQTSASPATADANQPVSLQVTVSNTTCATGGAQRCSLQFPFGDSKTNWTNCTYLSSSLTLTHSYPVPGNYVPGQGGNITVYTSGACTPGTSSGSVSLGSTFLTVLPDPSVSASALPSTLADSGQSLQLTATPSGGVSPYSFVWTGLPPGCLTNDSPVLGCTPAASGRYSVNVEVTDQLGVSGSTQLVLYLDPRPTAALNASARQVDAGQSVTWTAFAAAGSGEYGYLWEGLPSPCAAANQSQVSCAPSTKGSYPVTVTVYDFRGVAAKSLPTTLVVASRLSVAVQGPGGSVGSGTPVDLLANTSGGTNPVTLQWAGLPAGCVGLGSPSVSCQPSAGTYYVKVSAHDGAGAYANATYTLVVSSGSLFGSGGSTEFIVLALGIVIIVVAAVVSVLLLRRRQREPPSRR